MKKLKNIPDLYNKLTHAINLDDEVAIHSILNYLNNNLDIIKNLAAEYNKYLDDNYLAIFFKWAAYYGNEQLIINIIKMLDTHEKNDKNNYENILTADNYFGFISAAENNHVNIIKIILESLDNQKHIKYNLLLVQESYVFKCLANNNHHNLINEILLSLDCQSIIYNKLNSIYINICFIQAIEQRNYANCKKILELRSKNLDLIKETLLYKDSLGFALACSLGSEKTVFNILKHCKDNDLLLEKVILAQECSGFNCAAESGYNTIVTAILDAIKNRTIILEKLLIQQNFYAFRQATINGHLNVVSKILAAAEKNPKLLKTMLTNQDCYSFYWAHRYGHNDIIREILSYVNNYDYLSYYYSSIFPDIIAEQGIKNKSNNMFFSNTKCTTNIKDTKDLFKVF